jgi:hypothetical protein
MTERHKGFTLDVSFNDFHGLPDISRKMLVTLAHLYLASFPMLKLDPDQEATWDRPQGMEGI